MVVRESEAARGAAVEGGVRRGDATTSPVHAAWCPGRFAAWAVQGPPVISFSFAKKAFLRSEFMPQSTGTLW